jgi:hypothetical protein
VLLRLRDEGSAFDSLLRRLLSRLLQLLAQHHAFPTVLCTALSAPRGAEHCGLLLREQLQLDHQLQLICSASILEAAPDEELIASGTTVEAVSDDVIAVHGELDSCHYTPSCTSSSYLACRPQLAGPGITADLGSHSSW